jgi:Xaa-Pro aminopeptidase
MEVIYDAFAKVLKDLLPVKENLIDLVAAEPKPTAPLSDLWVLKQEFSGMNSHDKVGYVRHKMKEYQCDCYVLTALDEIAWLLNSNLARLQRKSLIVVRGNDMACNPLFYSFLVFLPEETFLFVEESQLNWPVLPSCQCV